MKNLRSVSSQKTLSVHPDPIGSGGQASVYKVSDHNLVVKIYHNATETPVEKLKVLIANSPKISTQSLSPSIAWPIDLVADGRGRPIGYTMPLIKESRVLNEVYIPKIRNINAVGFNWKFLHTACLNICTIVESIHDMGLLIGDLKTTNFLVNRRASVTLVDVDSIFVRDPRSRRIYPCPVLTGEFTAPEIMRRQGALSFSQAESQDLFALGTTLFYLIFGSHPYSGKWNRSGLQPTLEELIAGGDWVFGQGRSLLPGPNCIPFEVVHPEVRNCFLKCFGSSRSRPSPKDWIRSLKRAIDDLETCALNANHIYSSHYGRCAWCEIEARSGFDPFPSISKGVRQTRNRNFQPIHLSEKPEPSFLRNLFGF